MKSYFLRFLCILAGLNTHHLAMAGGESSGGGNAVVCLSQNNEILSAELLDLYEGRILHKLSYPNSNLSFLEQARLAGKTIDRGWESSSASPPEGAHTVETLVNRISKQIELLPNGIGLSPIDDSEHVIIPPKNCKITQIARYNDDNRLFIDEKLWTKLDDKNKAALLVHEALYSYLRFMGEVNSKRVRLAVAHGFAHSKFISLYEGIPNNAEYCETSTIENGHNSIFYAYPGEQNQVILQFIRFNGKIMISKSTAVFYGAKWPLSITAQESFSTLTKMESLIDQNASVFITFESEPNDYIGSIGAITPGRIPVPHEKFSCKLQD